MVLILLRRGGNGSTCHGPPNADDCLAADAHECLSDTTIPSGGSHAKSLDDSAEDDDFVWHLLRGSAITDSTIASNPFGVVDDDICPTGEVLQVDLNATNEEPSGQAAHRSSEDFVWHLLRGSVSADEIGDFRWAGVVERGNQLAMWFWVRY